MESFISGLGGILVGAILVYLFHPGGLRETILRWKERHSKEF